MTRERVRQIEAQALRKLRHPSRSKTLADEESPLKGPVRNAGSCSASHEPAPRAYLAQRIPFVYGGENVKNLAWFKRRDQVLTVIWSNTQASSRQPRRLLCGF